jgi:asparagine synthase (glutamine-hydrolysing)
MCGICGIYSYGADAPPVDPAVLATVRDSMASRGPDGAGLWVDAGGRVGLGHRRLAILDLSDRGAQPMSSADGRYRIVFNGEIYNFLDLRRDLENRGYAFRSASDTEVLLRLYEDAGAGMLTRLRGMYAFAIWDEPRQGLFLARDSFGIKPLYYAHVGSTFRFASQVRALRTDPSVGSEPDPAGHVGFHVWGTVPEPHTLYRRVRSLPAGTSLWVDSKGPATSKTYFSIREELIRAEAEPFETGHLALGRVRDALSVSVGAHLVSDVPVGVFLSAGLDSGAIAILAAARTGEKLRTLTLGFGEYRGTEYDEVPLAEDVARRCGSKHETHWLSRADWQEAREGFFRSMDQPSLDGLNVFLVSREAARARLKVALTGVGGDEMLAGYPSFRTLPRAVRLLESTRLPRSVGRMARRLAARSASWLGRPKYAGVVEYGSSYGGAYLLLRGLFMPWELEGLLDSDLVREGWEGLDLLARLEETTRGIRSSRLRVMALEATWYLRNQLLRDTDWASMAHSVEVRVPMLDVDLLRVAARLPAAATKRSVVEGLKPNLSEPVLGRRKTGFLVPLRQWTRSTAHQADPGLRLWAREVYAGFRGA